MSKNLDYFIKKIEDETLLKKEEEKLNEQKIIDQYNQQRQFMLNERKMYERIYSANSSGGLRKKNNDDYLVDENGDYFIDENVDYFITI